MKKNPKRTIVYILNEDNEPLLPTTRFEHVRKLLKDGKAKVIKREAFTIKLLYKTSNYTQPLILGVDTGSKYIGTAVSTTEGNIIYISQIEERDDIKIKMNRRRIHRINRRFRKTRYRKWKVLNRATQRRLNRYPPTLISKFHSHIKEIEFIKSILPITQLILECGKLDLALIQDPTLKYRKWGYQKGPNYGFEDTKARVLFRDNYTCQICKNRRKESRLEIHHIIPKSKNGSDEAENLITLCHLCHEDLHNGIINTDLKGKKRNNIRYSAQMNIIRSMLFKYYPEAIETFGSVTKANRNFYNIPKEHYTDACIIASGEKFPNLIINQILYKKHVPEGDYQQTRGSHSEQKLTTCKVLGFKKFDKVIYKGKKCFIRGRIVAYGFCDLMDIEGNKLKFPTTKKCQKTPRLALCKRLNSRRSIIQMYKTI